MVFPNIRLATENIVACFAQIQATKKIHNTKTWVPSKILDGLSWWAPDKFSFEFLISGPKPEAPPVMTGI